VLTMGCAQRSVPKAWRRDSSPVEAQATNVLPPALRCDDVAGQTRELRFPQTRPGHDATFESRFLAKEHPLALPVVDFVAVLIKLDVDSVPQINGGEESRAVSPISAQRLLLKRLTLPSDSGCRASWSTSSRTMTFGRSPKRSSALR
jgi:hypothetical protein